METRLFLESDELGRHPIEVTYDVFGSGQRITLDILEIKVFGLEWDIEKRADNDDTWSFYNAVYGALCDYVRSLDKHGPDIDLSYCGCSVTNKFRRILYKAQKKDPKIKFLHAAQFSPNRNGSFSLEYGHPEGPLVDLSTFEQLEKYVADMPGRNPILYRQFRLEE